LVKADLSKDQAGSSAGSIVSWLERARPRLRKIFARTNRRPTNRYEGLPHGYICWIDEPINWRGVTRRFRLSGWCFSRDGAKVEGLRARLGDREFIVSHGLARPDVATAYPDQAGALHSGFEVVVEAPRGVVHRLCFEARHSEGSWREIFSKQIVVSRDASTSYEDWIRNYDTLRFGDYSRIRKQIETYRIKPRFSILMVVSVPASEYLRAAIKSVRVQLYPHWKLWIIADESLPEKTRHIIERAERDRRIEVRRRKRAEVADALNEALFLTEGEFVLTLGSEDKLAPTALYLVTSAINNQREAHLIYSDEDMLDSAGYRTEPHFKSDWNWPLLLGQDFVSQLTVFRADLAKSLGFRPGLGGAHDYDLLLRFAEKLEPHQIHHLPYVLYHRRTVTQSVEASLDAGAMKAVEQHLKRQGVEAQVTYTSNKLSRRVRYLLRDVQPTVSIIVPTRDRVELLQPCVESILEKTAYSSFELILIDNGSRASATLDYLASISGEPRVRVFRQDEEFNYSRLSNCGVRSSNAEFILLMNNDVNVIKPGWLEEMVSHGIQPGVGAVGARLLYPDNRVQQAGVILEAGVHGVAEVAHRGLARGDPGYFCRAILAQELSAVGAACMLVRREVYLEVGGFDEEHLKVAFNDIDFCLKLRARGYRIIFAPEAELYHHEHASRGTEYTETNEQRFNREIDFMKEKWKDALLVDRYYNPNLSLGNALFTLAFPPRVSKPWQSTY
jgi:GT2 family glycosyltransferase